MVVQFKYFMKNLDQSSFSFRHFNFEPGDEYPAISICWVDDKSITKNRDQMFESNGVNFTYEQLLRGEGNVTSDFTMIDFDDVIIDYVSNTVNEAYTVTKHGEITNVLSRSAKSVYSKTHQDCSRICYRRISIFEKDLIYDHESLDFGLENLVNGNVYPFDQIDVYVHQSGQLIRRMASPVSVSYTHLTLPTKA